MNILDRTYGRTYNRTPIAISINRLNFCPSCDRIYEFFIDHGMTKIDYDFEGYPKDGWNRLECPSCREKKRKVEKGALLREETRIEKKKLFYQKKYPKILELLNQHKALNEISELVDISLDRLLRIKKKFESEGFTFTCYCGRELSHHGWCQERVEKSIFKKNVTDKQL